MNKKSQFYMFAGIILIVSVFFIVANKSFVKINKIKDFQNYLENYMYEAVIVLNNAVYENTNASVSLKEYTESFLEYAEDKNIDLGIVYLFSKEDEIHIVNYLNEPMLVSSLSLNPEQEYSMNFDNDVSIRYQNETYNYYFSNSDEIEFKTLFVKEDG